MNQETINNDLRWLMAHMLQEFPGLRDGEKEVSGSELVQFLDYQLNAMKHLKYLRFEKPLSNVVIWEKPKLKVTHYELPAWAMLPHAKCWEDNAIMYDFDGMGSEHDEVCMRLIAPEENFTVWFNSLGHPDMADSLRVLLDYELSDKYERYAESRRLAKNLMEEKSCSSANLSTANSQT